MKNIRLGIADYYLVFCIVVSGIALIFLKFEWNFKFWQDYFVFSDKNDEIATYFNGITTPIIAFASGYLVYLSFREQYKTNQIQFEELKNRRNFEIFNSLSFQIDNSINLLNFVYTESKVEKNSTNIEALQIFLLHMSLRKDEKFNHKNDFLNYYAKSHNILLLLIRLHNLLDMLLQYCMIYESTYKKIEKQSTDYKEIINYRIQSYKDIIINYLYQLRDINQYKIEEDNIKEFKEKIFKKNQKLIEIFERIKPLNNENSPNQS
jgi:hypothetical protein